MDIDRLFIHRIKNPQNSGFTLIELLVVVIILGVISAVAIPTFLRQTGKAREAEVLAILGAINRSQQAHHWENGRFSDNLSSLVAGGTGNTLTSRFHTINQDSYNPTDSVTYKATALQVEDNARNFALGIYFDTGKFSTAICRSAQVGVDVNVGSSSDDDCTNNGQRIK